MADALAEAWVQLVCKWEEEELPAYVRAGIRSRAATVGPLLDERLGDPAIFDGWAIVHVLRLIGELRVESAIPALVDLLWDAPHLEEPHEVLCTFGPAAVPALLAQADRFPREIVPTLALCGAGTGDPRIREAVARLIPLDLDRGAGAAADFGDPSLVAELLGALERFDAARPGLQGHAVIELVDAIERLGGDPGELGRAKRAQVHQAMAPLRDRFHDLVDR